MASVNGVLSPTPQQSDFQGANNDAITLSAKRKREESTDAQITANGTSDSKSPEQIAASIEQNRSLVRDLVDVLKT
jgi:hypothetical protein